MSSRLIGGRYSQRKTPAKGIILFGGEEHTTETLQKMPLHPSQTRPVNVFVQIGREPFYKKCLRKKQAEWTRFRPLDNNEFTKNNSNLLALFMRLSSE